MPLPIRVRAALAGAALLAAAVAAGSLPAQPRRPAAPADSTAADSSARLPLDGLRFRQLGPGSTSGRISDVVVHPRRPATWYVATASGGLWKTENAGTTFTPIFDQQGAFSIGALALDQRNPNVLWVGTGENNSLRSVAYGDGVYKSIDGGRTFTNVGLPRSEHIGRIVIDPRNSDVVYVAAIGPLWSGGGDRGLYKTTDGGRTWTRLLGGGEWAGVNDVQLDPRNPDVLLASTFQRQRRVWGQIHGGPESGLHRSTDGGATWTRLRTGLPGGDLGRIGLAISPADPDYAYAVIEAGGGGAGFYRSTDGGASWARMSGEVGLGLFYQELFPDPHDRDRVYQVEVNTSVTEDGGRTWTRLGSSGQHVDHHAVWIDPADPQHLLLGTDGGLYETFDRGGAWRWFANLPLTQFYTVALDDATPFYNVCGGTQDNNTVCGPSQNAKATGIENSDWRTIVGGDGFRVQVDPTDPDIVYAESQNGGMVRHDRRTGENIPIRPQPEPGEPPSRWYWDTPILISPHAPQRLYVGSQRLWRSDDRGDSWRAVSGDLTRAIDRNQLRMMGRVWGSDAIGKWASTSFYGTIIAISESPKQAGLLYVGTDDGLVQVSEDGGATWRASSRFPGVPDTTYVQRVVASRHDANVAYAVFNNHRSGDFAPYVVKTADRGRTWTNIGGTLPARGSVYGFVEDPREPRLLFAGTEFALFVSVDGGARWTRLRGGLPTIQMRDLAIHARDDDLVVATFGRGFWVLDDLAPLRALARRPELARAEAALLPVTRTNMWLPERTSNAGAWGGANFSAGNPEPGTTISYLVGRAPRTARAARLAREQAAARRGEDVPQPTLEQLRAEDLEETPQAQLTITDADGRVVRRLTGPAGAGLHRVQWDLRWSGLSPVAAAAAGGDGGGEGRGGSRGPFVVPGPYTVTLALRLPDGAVREVGRETFTAAPPAERARTVATDPAVQAFRLETARLQRVVLGTAALLTETIARVRALEAALPQAHVAVDTLQRDARALARRLDTLRLALNGDNTPSRLQQPSEPGLVSRLTDLVNGHWSTQQAPTGTQRRQFDLVARDAPPLLAQLRAIVERDLPALEARAERAGAPWTPGRVPAWP
jgi:photosystem II stability/assembly factor-like uncharacterized protein